MAVLGLCFCVQAFSSCSERGPLFLAVRGPLTIAAFLVVEHRLYTRRLSSCGSQAQLLCGMWYLPRPGLEPVSPALAGRFSTTAPPGKPYFSFILVFLTSLETKSGKCKAVILIVFLLLLKNHFSLSYWRSLSLVFGNLIMVCLSVDFFAFILFGIHPASWICTFMGFGKIRKFSTIIFSRIFQPHPLSLFILELWWLKC